MSMLAGASGTFRMGDLSQMGYDNERPVHAVSVPAFRLGKHEVTFDQWGACVADGGCKGYMPDGGSWGNRPVTGVSQYDAEAFIGWLNDKTGGNYRLPTEAEWEYAARAGSTTKYSWGNDIGGTRANCMECGSRWDGRQTAPVGSFQANLWGLHDMHGNVAEWVQDCWNDSYKGAPKDGSAWTSGDYNRRVVRGGSWKLDARNLRSAFRGRFARSARNDDVGFRLAQDKWSGTQTSNEVEAAPGADRTGTGQPAVEPDVFPPAEEEDEVARLLAAAERDLAALRLTSPVDNNAWEKYQRVLDLEPGNRDALTGLQQVIDSYWKLFAAALGREEFDKAEGYLAKIRELRPDSPDMEEDEQRLAAARRKAEQAARQAELERQKLEQQTQEVARRKAQQYASEMVAIPGGTFRMGDLSGKGRAAEKPAHTVTVPPFRLGKYEVTFALWDACVADGGCNGHPPDDEGWGRGNRPVINVSRNDVQSFIDWMNSRTGGNYRLPSEAEWEYAARAGSTAEYSWGNDRGLNRANCAGWFCGWDSYEHTAPVGSFPANAWGLHDMHGNVWEWVQDCWNYSYEGAPGDGSAWGRTVPEIPSWQLSNKGASSGGSAWESGNCTDLVVRGGSWRGYRDHLRSASRSKSRRTIGRSDLGFRLAQDK